MARQDEAVSGKFSFIKRVQLLAVPVIFLVIIMVAVAMALSFSPEARRVPMTVGIPTLAICLAVVFFEIRRFRQPGRLAAHLKKTERVAGTSAEASPGAFSESRIFTSYLLLTATYLLFGFPFGAIVFLLVFLGIIGRRRWLTAALITTGLIIPLHFVLAGWFNVSTLDGRLFR